MCKKSIFSVLAAAAVAALSLVSCDKIKNDIQYLGAQIVIDESQIPENMPKPDTYDVTFTNKVTGYSVSVKSSLNEKGEKIASTSNIISGVYDITVTANATLGGRQFNFTGSQTNVTIVATLADCVVAVTGAEAGDLVIKEVLYNAADDGTAAGYQLQTFIEIYNNSDEVKYADGLAIGMPLSRETYQWTYQKDGYEKDEVTYDVGIPDDEKYVFLGNTVWQAPGTGTQYPIQPGESIVIAAYAKNHTETVNSSIDLSTADFENFCEHYKETNGQVDCNAINMNLTSAIATVTKYYSITVTGRGIVLFRPSVPLRDGNFIRSSNYPTTVGLEILKSDVIDAVDFVNKASSQKYIDSDLDAGKLLNQGNKSGKGYLRKTKETRQDGRIILQDTNNSSNDFISTDETEEKKPVIRRNAKRCAWSTWTTAL